MNPKLLHAAIMAGMGFAFTTDPAPRRRPSTSRRSGYRTERKAGVGRVKLRRRASHRRKERNR